MNWNLRHGAGKKLEDICPSTHNMEVPNVVRKDYMLIGMEDGFLSLMDDSGETRDDLKCPEDSIGDEIKKAIADEIDILVCGVKHPHKKFTHLCPLLLIKIITDTVNAIVILKVVFQCTVLTACGEECVIATKVNTAMDK